MDEQTILSMEAVIGYIEDHLYEKLDLKTVAEAVHYSKYHLHRMFTATLGMTLHDYVQRRQLTEAAKLLVFSEKPIIEIAFLCGYESQQAFSSTFKAMYKFPPAHYRDNCVFYPLQLRFTLRCDPQDMDLKQDDIQWAEKPDIPAWMELMRLVIDGYPVMEENDYLEKLNQFIEEKRALVLKKQGALVGVMAFSAQSGCIEFLGVHPQYRRLGVQKLFLDALLTRHLPGREIWMTTYREGDRADTGHREMLKQLGFAERELMVEFGYPTQRFVYVPEESKR